MVEFKMVVKAIAREPALEIQHAFDRFRRRDVAGCFHDSKMKVAADGTLDL